MSDYELRQRGLFVEVHNNDLNKALRKLKKLTQSEGLLQELRARERFESPSVKKNKQKARAKKRWQKKLKELKASGKAI
jgi:small subunit ribosomal protein S21